MMMSAIIVNNLVKHFELSKREKRGKNSQKEPNKAMNITKAVDNISFEVKKGEILGLLGPNGAGKTTTYRILAGYLRPTSGTIKVKDYNIYDHLIEIKKLIGVKVIGMTACPCAREIIKTIGEYHEKDIPPTHNQRNITTLMIEVPGDDKSVDANDLIDIAEQSFSSPTYGLLKRKEEAELVLEAHKKPKFVEDVVRDMLSAVLKKYKDLPDDVIVISRSESEESIHKHNAFAERVTTLGELRK